MHKSAIIIRAIPEVNRRDVFSLPLFLPRPKLNAQTMNDNPNLHHASGRSKYQPTYDERIDLLVDLALLMVEGELPHGQQENVAVRHSVSCKTVRNILKRLKKGKACGNR